MISVDLEGIRWVWFDLDDTLWDFTTNTDVALSEVYKIHSLSRWFTSVDNWLETYHTHNRALWELYNAGKITKGYLQSERFSRTLVSAGVPTEAVDVLASKLNVDYLAILGKCTTLIPGAVELLEAVNRRGLKVGILSNGFKEVQFDKLRSGGILDKVDCIVLSDEIDVNKPDRRIFDYALSKAGAAASESIFIGDNPETDILGAVNAGWRTIFFNRHKTAYVLPPSVPVADSLFEMVEMLAR